VREHTPSSDEPFHILSSSRESTSKSEKTNGEEDDGSPSERVCQCTGERHERRRAERIGGPDPDELVCSLKFCGDSGECSADSSLKNKILARGH
jgi:hypothetical protein